MLIHRESLELAKNAAPAGDGVPFTTSCVQVGEDGGVDEAHVSLVDTTTGEVLFEGSGSDLSRAAREARD